MQIILVAALVFALLVGIFAVQNALPVDISLLIWTFHSISLAVVILGSIAAGALLVLPFSLVRQYRLRRELKAIREECRRLAGELREQAGAALPAEPQTPADPCDGVKAERGPQA